MGLGKHCKEEFTEGDGVARATNIVVKMQNVYLSDEIYEDKVED